MSGHFPGIFLGVDLKYLDRLICVTGYKLIILSRNDIPLPFAYKVAQLVRFCAVVTGRVQFSQGFFSMSQTCPQWCGPRSWPGAADREAP